MSTEFKVQASVKDADGDMVNFRADSNEELDSLFAEFPYASYAQAKAALRGAGAASAITQPHQQQAAPQQPAQPQSPWQPQQAPQQNAGGPQNGQPHPEGKQCQQCGTVLKYKSGTSKAGNAYRMWACPNGRARNDGHQSEFIR